jgi:hypothetical protein
VLESAELRRGDRSGPYRGQMQLFEETLVVLPAGTSSAVGTRVLAFEPGEVLALPGASVAAAEPEPAPAPTPAPVAEAAPQDPRTAFTPTGQPVLVQRAMSTSLTEQGPSVRPGEILAAPWADVEGGPAGSGRVLESAELRRGDRSGPYRGQMQLFEETLVVLPAGTSSAVGTRVLAFEPGEVIRGRTEKSSRQIMYPLGVLEVIRSPAAGEATVARVVRLFGMVRPGALLMPFDSSAVRAGGDPTIVLGDAGPVTTVRWVWRGQPLPSLQSYVLLDATDADGVRVGDRYTIFRPRTPAANDGDPDSPALDAATAQIVRVTPNGSTAMILGSRRPLVEAGMPARATARVP